MKFLSGYKTYIGIISALLPTLYGIYEAGVASGQSLIVTVGLIIAAIGRYLATKPV